MNTKAILDNLFPASWPAIEPRETFPWHIDRQGEIDTYKKHSSQALAIDVFGTLKYSPDRTAILNSFANTWGLPTSKEWEIHLEWLDPENILHERRRSQIDVVASSPQTIIFFECKFTEKDGGSCSQHPSQCSGNYEVQVNPRNQKLDRCALSAKGIRYWQIVSRVFHLNTDQDYRPCPFSGSWFQWMRNLTVCYEVSRASYRKAAFVLVYADAPGFPMAEKLKSQEWDKFNRALRHEAVTFRWTSYQQVVQQGKKVSEQGEWKALQQWVEDKISLVAERFKH